MPFFWFSRKKAKKRVANAVEAPKTPQLVEKARRRSVSVERQLELLSLDVGGQLGDDARDKLQAVRLSPEEGTEALRQLGTGTDGQVNEQVLAHVLASVRPGLGLKGVRGLASYADVKWVIRRVEVSLWFGDFAESEMATGYPAESYSTLPPAIGRYLDAVLPAAERSDGWWIVGGHGETWQELYDSWVTAAQALEHIKAAKRRCAGAVIDIYPPLPIRQMRPALHVVVDEADKPINMLQAAVRGATLASYLLDSTSLLSQRSKTALGLAEGPMYRPFTTNTTPTRVQRLPRSVSGSSDLGPDPVWTEFAESGFGEIALEAQPDALTLSKRGIVELDDGFVDFFNDVANDPSVAAQWPAFAVFELAEKAANTLGAELLLVSSPGRSITESVSGRSPSVRLDSFKRSNDRRLSLFGTLARSPSTLFAKRQDISEEKTDDASTRALYVPTPTDGQSIANLSIDSRPLDIATDGRPDSLNIDKARRERSLAPSPSPQPSYVALAPPVTLTNASQSTQPLPTTLEPLENPLTEHLEPHSPNADAKSDHTFGNAHD